MAHQMYDAGLDCRIGKGRIDGIKEAFEAFENGDQDVVDAAIAQIVHHQEPEFGPFIGGDPQAQNLAFALGVDA